jgi:protein-disulfide isomerase
MDGLSDQEQGSGGGRAATAAGWIAFLLLLALVGYFGYRVWTYYELIRSGKIVELPQFSASLTRVGDAGGSGSIVVDRSVLESGDNPSLGAEEAGLTVVQFADFECPYSREVSNAVRRVMARYGDRVRLIYRDFPLAAIHVNAFQAAVAAECAREQGKFWPYHDKLYLNSPALGYDSLLRYGQEIGLEPRQFERCLAENRYRSKVDADIASAKLIGLQGTPTFFFNGQKVEGAIPEDIFERIVADMLQ